MLFSASNRSRRTRICKATRHCASFDGCRGGRSWTMSCHIVRTSTLSPGKCETIRGASDGYDSQWSNRNWRMSSCVSVLASSFSVAAVAFFLPRYASFVELDDAVRLDP